MSRRWRHFLGRGGGAVGLAGVGVRAGGGAPAGPYENVPIARPGGQARAGPSAADTPASLGMVRVVLALSAVLGLIFALRWGLRRWSAVSAAAPDAIRIISR